MKPEELIPNKIYSVTWSGETQIVGRYKGVRQAATKEHTFYDCLHYWNAHETFHYEEHVLLGCAEEIRNASLAEKRLLTEYEIEHDLI